ncbi:MAG: tRNA pseudouridine(55) synthase TruB [Elusimicrobiota bacterium]
MTMPEGLLLADKPKGWTSHDVVAAVRSLLPRGTKVGHSGTLDPMATGLLVLLIGRATKKAAVYQGLPKTYSGRIRLGIETETGDLDGATTREAPVPETSQAELQALFDRYLGLVELPVPRFSAVKCKGRPLYSYARRGVEVPPMKRSSRVYSWDLLGWAPPEAAFRLSCSSGTYVRSLAVRVGEELGCGGTLSALRRDSVGSFDLSRALTIDRIRALAAEGIPALMRHAVEPLPQEARA